MSFSLGPRSLSLLWSLGLSSDYPQFSIPHYYVFLFHSQPCPFSPVPSHTWFCCPFPSSSPTLWSLLFPILNGRMKVVVLASDSVETLPHPGTPTAGQRRKRRRQSMGGVVVRDSRAWGVGVG